MRHYLWMSLFIVLINPISTYAGDGPGFDYPKHRGESEWGFNFLATPSDTYVVNDADSNTIDRYMFRSQGEIVINIPIRRYVGPTDGNGYLQNIDTLIAQGVVSSNTKIYLPAFDVDEGIFPVFDCDYDGIYDQLYDEVNELYFNGEKLGKLRGKNRKWSHQRRVIPTGKLKFPSAPGGVAINEIRIKIDVANEDVVLSSGRVGCVVWATSIDWVAIQFDAAAPVVLVHGMKSTGSELQDLKTGFNSFNMLADNSITFPPQDKPSVMPYGCGSEPYNESIAFNVAYLKTEVPRILQEFGASSVNFVAHSKGGLDSLGFISQTQGDNAIKVIVGKMSGMDVKHKIKTNSLVTLNTPHKGSILAQYGVLARHASSLSVLTSENLSDIDKLLLLGVKKQGGSWYCDLTPERASAFVSKAILPKGISTASTATNADINNDGVITGSESENFPIGGVIADLSASVSHFIVGSVASVQIGIIPTSWYEPDEVVITPGTYTQFMSNDVVVTQDSAGHYATYSNIDDLNHLNVHKLSTANAIAKDAQSKTGLVNWRVK